MQRNCFYSRLVSFHTVHRVVFRVYQAVLCRRGRRFVSYYLVMGGLNPIKRCVYYYLEVYINNKVRVGYNSQTDKLADF